MEVNDKQYTRSTFTEKYNHCVWPFPRNLRLLWKSWLEHRPVGQCAVSRFCMNSCLKCTKVSDLPNTVEFDSCFDCLHTLIATKQVLLFVTIVQNTIYDKCFSDLQLNHFSAV